MNPAHKRPESVLVVVIGHDHRILLLKRRSARFWQSVTGSLEWGESPAAAARRELVEETGLGVDEADLIDCRVCHRFPLPAAALERYPPGTRYNREYLFGCHLSTDRAIEIEPREHDEYGWFEAPAALGKTWSWTNRQGIKRLLGLRSV